MHGQGGTGKSTLLNAILQTFLRKGVPHLLAKTATSGVAATMIGGQTLHTWAGLPITPHSAEKSLTSPSKDIEQRRRRNFGHTVWLLIDEMSMLTTPTLKLLSRVGSIVRSSLGFAKQHCGIAFGNVNVVLLSDLHQFPPVATFQKELYCDCSQEYFPQLGHSLYEQFDTVIKLNEQMHVQDPVWNRILQCLRTGDCTSMDINEIRKLILGRPDCVLPDFSSSPWNDAVLVTPRNGACNFWNEKALEQHCRKTQHTLFTVYAHDCNNDRVLTAKQCLDVANLKRKETCQLPNKIEITIGMKAMVLLNIATEADLTNGT